MEQLPGADSVFLAMETPDAPAHVGGLTVLDASRILLRNSRYLGRCF